MSLDKAISDAMSTIPECVAGGYVDMTSGMLLGVKTLNSHPQEILDMVAATTADLFEGQNIRHIEQAFAKARGIENDHPRYFQEVMVFSENLLHIFMRAKKQPDHVLVFVCRRNANVGMVLTKSRMALDAVRAPP
ncbi:hypothetical protein [Paenirhodobacter enshiensis]|uniref:hypothetical protein n=1 Tax=Paenirhodobacter enshiensis TaxID=1105367 RepID=UPI003FA297A3